MSETESQFESLDPSLDYTETVPMQHSTSWIANENLDELAKLAAEEEFGDPDHEVRFALMAAFEGEASDDWMASEHGTAYWTLKGVVEEKAKEYRAVVFADDLKDGGRDD